MTKNLFDRDYFLGLSLFSGIGIKKYQIIKNIFGSAKNFYLAKDKDLKNSNLSYGSYKRFLSFRHKADLHSYKIRLEKNLIKFLTIEDNNYPKLLKEIPSPPLVIYFKGNILDTDELALAVVGSRRVTSYGRRVTEKLTKDLVKKGFTIISGLARGVDSIAHRTALSLGGRTMAVLASGLDWIYPPEHKGLAQEITKQGALISEYPLGQRPSRGQFPARNRIISGLSLGVLITEGASRSGTKITANMAANQGREVFCVPGPINSPLSEGPADLIKQGAKLTTSINDILEEFRERISF